jgi:hypothetical protein
MNSPEYYLLLVEQRGWKPETLEHVLIVFAFSLFGKFLLLFFRDRHAAICRLQTDASALIPMAQMKPNNSRATAVMVFLCSLPIDGLRQVTRL